VLRAACCVLRRCRCRVGRQARKVYDTKKDKNGAKEKEKGSKQRSSKTPDPS
jgi:hypothetical protein